MTKTSTTTTLGKLAIAFSLVWLTICFGMFLIAWRWLSIQNWLDSVDVFSTIFLEIMVGGQIWVLVSLTLYLIMNRIGYRSILRMAALFILGFMVWFPVTYAVGVWGADIVQGREFMSLQTMFVRADIDGVPQYVRILLLSAQYFVAFSLSAFAAYHVEFQRSSEEILRRQSELYRIEKESKKQKLRALQLQLGPEYLSASLNKVITFAKQNNPEGVVELTALLGDSLRYIVQAGSVDTVPVHEEIAFLTTVVEFFNLGAGAQVKIELSGDRFGSDIVCPPFTLYSLVADCIEEEGSDQDVSVLIRSSISEQDLELSVAVNGQTGTNPHITQIRRDNLATRIALQYGSRGAFESSSKGSAHQYRIVLPSSYPEADLR